MFNYLVKFFISHILSGIMLFAYTDVVSGVRTAGGGLAANQKVDVDTALKILKPYQTPIMQFTYFSGKSSKPVINKYGKFSWFEDELFPDKTTVAVAITASTTLTLTDANIAKKIFKLYDEVYFEDTDEIGYVTSVTAGGGTDVVVSHIDGSSSLTSVTTVGSVIRIIGSVNIEDNTTPNSMSTKEVEKYNYCQIYTESVANTGRDQAGENYTDGLTHAEQVQKKMEEMKLQFERNAIFAKTCGQAGTTSASRSWSQGLNGRITTNSTSYSGVLTEEIFDAHLLKTSAKGANKKVHYCGRDQYDQITQIVKKKFGTVNVTEMPEKYGARIQFYKHSLCDVDVVCHQAMDGKFSNYGWTVEYANLSGRHMANDDKGSRKFRIQANVETPGKDRKETKLLMDVATQYVQEETGGVLYQKA